MDVFTLAHSLSWQGLQILVGRWILLLSDPDMAEHQQLGLIWTLNYFIALFASIPSPPTKCRFACREHLSYHSFRTHSTYFIKTNRGVNFPVSAASSVYGKISSISCQ